MTCFFIYLKTFSYTNRNVQLPKQKQQSNQIIKNNLKRRDVKCICVVGDQTAIDLVRHIQNISWSKICYIPVSMEEMNGYGGGHGDLLSVTQYKLGFDSMLNKTSIWPSIIQSGYI